MRATRDRRLPCCLFTVSVFPFPLPIVTCVTKNEKRREREKRDEQGEKGKEGDVEIEGMIIMR